MSTHRILRAAHVETVHALSATFRHDTPNRPGTSHPSGEGLGTSLPESLASVRHQPCGLPILRDAAGTASVLVPES